MTKKEQKNMKDFILYLRKGYLDYCKEKGEKGKDGKFKDDRYIDHIIYIAVKDITSCIGEKKNPKISEKARRGLKLDKKVDFTEVKNAREQYKDVTVQEHYKPAIYFFDEIKGKSFTSKDADRWLNEAVVAIIHRNEDIKLNKDGDRTNRPNPKSAYKKAGIKLVRVAPGKG